MKTLIICLSVFIAKVVEISIASVRTIYLVKQKNLISCILAFIEIIIWFFVAREILVDANSNFFIVASYAGGYAAGTYLGGIINKYFVK